jgi:iron complex outermembrane receptor protein
LGTIIVTARKRPERLQDVPVSVSVVQGDTLNKLQFNHSTELQHLVPGLVSSHQEGGSTFGFFIRGIGTSTFAAETIQPSTAYVVDGVVIEQGAAQLTDLPDISQIEVLRGPQSTLFGVSASAGVIKITTRKPSFDAYTFRGGISYGSPDKDRHAYAWLSGPIGSSHKLAFSLSARRSLRDGFVKNIPDGRTFNNRNDSGFRGKLQWKPSDRFTATLIGDYWQSNTHCCMWTVQRFGPPGGTDTVPRLEYYEPPAVALLGTLNPGRDNQKQTLDGSVFYNVKNYGASLKLDVDLGDGYSLTSISAWRGFKSLGNFDSDSSPLDFLDVNWTRFRQNQISQELRLTSPKGGLVDYVAGLFYMRQRVHDYLVQLFPPLPGYVEFPNPTPPPATYRPFLFLNKHDYNHSAIYNQAAYGQVNFHPTDKLVLSVGGRLLHYRERQEGHNRSHGSENESLVRRHIRYLPDLSVRRQLSLHL